MATRIETLGGGKRAPKAAFRLFAIVMIAAALAIGTLVGSDPTTEPSRPADAGSVSALEPATHVPGLVKAGLQPRPFSEIPVTEAVTVEKVPDGFVKIPGGELRPTFGP
jgi:hypothetical protein